MKKLLLLLFFSILSMLTIASSKPLPRQRMETIIRYQDYEDVFELCNGEIVHLQGIMRLTMHSSGGEVNIQKRYKLEFLNVTGTSETGVRYRLLGQESLLLRTFSWGETFAITGMRTMRFIAQGSGMELMIADRHHIAVLPDGTFNFVVDSRSIHCDTEHIIFH